MNAFIPVFAPDAKQLSDLPYFNEHRWNPDRSGDYTADCILGRQAARDVVNLIRQSENPALLSSVALAIAESGQWGATEIGFFHQLSEML